MGTERWLLPEGIDEVLPPRAAQLERLRRDVLDLFHRWGYDLVIPPLIEFVDSLIIGTGTDLDLQTFKLTDQLSGRTLGVRADMTPQAARIDAHRLRRDTPERLCYLGTVLRTRPDGFAASRAPVQVGAELYGHGGAESDAEIILLMLETLRTAGIAGEIHIDLGHVGIYRGLARYAGLDAARETELFDALQRKARAEIDALIAPLAADARAMLAKLIELNGGADVLPQARAALKKAPPAVHAAIDNLEQISRLLQRSAGALPLYFDLAELRGYQYQTGIVFAAYVPGYGQEVARGGRYDDIGKVFGRARPATGFSSDLKTLMTLAAAPATVSTAIFAPADSDPALAEAVARLRQNGERVVCALPGQTGGAREMNCDRALVRSDEKWVVTVA